MLDRILEWLTAPFSRTARLVVLPIVGLMLVTTFVFLGFPYEVLADRAVNALERQTGAMIRYGEVEPRLIPAPGFRFHQVDVRTADGRRYQADPVSVRPAWSLGWLTGEPQIRAYMVSDHGSLAGFVTVGRGVYAWDGRIVDLDLAALPLPADQRIELTGRADIDADVRWDDGAAEGEIELTARQGEVVHSMVPMPIEFESVTGRIELGGEALARIDSFALEGPLFGAAVSGSIGQAADPTKAPLDLQIGIDVREPGMRSMAKQFGLTLDEDGHADLDVSGTVSKPRLR